jgi:hypothetical protein
MRIPALGPGTHKTQHCQSHTERDIDMLSKRYSTVHYEPKVPSRVNMIKNDTEFNRITQSSKIDKLTLPCMTRPVCSNQLKIALNLPKTMSSA